MGKVAIEKEFDMNNMNEVTLLITACDRNDLLKRTVESFLKYNTYPIKELIIRDDSGLDYVYEEMIKILTELDLPFPLIALPIGQIGQGASIDLMMSRVTTPYVFHCEDDWEFTNPGFIEKSMLILQNDPSIIQVWIRDATDDTHTQFSEDRHQVGNVIYRKVVRDHNTHGYTFNPHLKRMSDYTKSYVDIKADDPIGEDAIGVYYMNQGFDSAWLIEGYCKHTGWDKSTYRPGTPYREGAKKI